MKYYFLFGEKICKLYYNTNDFQDVVNKIKEGHCDWSVFCYNENLEHPTELIQASMGWGEFAEITEEEYSLILAIEAPQKISI